MENRVPLPTDNIFKFYALFGLLLIVFSFSASIYTTTMINDQVYTAVVDLEELKSIATPSVRESARRAVLERQMEVAKSDRKTYTWSCGLLAVIGMAGVMFGFGRWHSVIQPKQDELLELQLIKLRQEVAQFESGSRRVSYDKARRG